jgi:alpha-glucosidase (family GH31 glycosyl hydrolase)
MNRLPSYRLPRCLAIIFFGWCTHSVLCAQTEPPSTTVIGHARFEVITPNLIRMEYAPDGAFVDAPSWFAVDRNARDAQAVILPRGNSLDINTGEIHLVYHDDGKPFSPENLSAEIKKGSDTVTWHPGVASTGNLGGTIRTLDQQKGPVPLGEGILSRDGWYLLDDSASPLFSENWIQSRPKNGGLDWYLFGYGFDYKAAFKSFTSVGGAIPLPRKYTLGVWYSRYWPYKSDEFKQIVSEYQQHEFPLDMIVMDMDWHLIDTNIPRVKRYYLNEIWTGYTWNKNLIPDPVQLLKWFHDDGLHVTLNDHPADGLQPHEEMYSDYMQAMGKDPKSGDTIPFDAGDKHYLDSFYQYSHLPREKEGVDFWWLDWQQYAKTRSLSDVSNLQVLNFYNYTRTEANGLRGQSFSRWAGWGDHRYPIQFSGDADTGWNMLAFEVPFTSTGGNVGAFFWSHDIGGHMGGRNEESYARWCQFGAFSAALRSHSTRNVAMDRRPWTYPDWAEKSMQVSFQLRSKMMPYLYSSIWQATNDSVPFIRPLYVDHPEMEDAYHNGQEYCFGDNLLVAPITMPGVGPDRTAWQAVWFPDDDWYDYFTGEKFTGPSYAVATAGIDTFPLFVRGGIPLPMQPYVSRPGTAPLTHLVLRCYPGRDGITGKSFVYEDDGVTNDYEKGGKAITPLTYVRDGDTTTITVGATEGKFNSQSESRQITIELPCTDKLTDCSAVGAQSDYDEKTETNSIILPESSIRQPLSVTIRAAIIAPDKIAREAVARRVAGLLGKSEDASPAADEVVPANLREAYAAAQGAALISMNQHPYFLNRETVLRFIHNHYSAPENASVTVGNDAAKIMVLIPGQPLPVALPANSVRSPGAPFLPGSVPVNISLTDLAHPLILTDMIPEGLDATRDIALQATAEASSGNAHAAIDGIVDGYPHDQSKEWASKGEKTGAWIKLSWPQPFGASSVALYDRPNLNDHILTGMLEFSDGSKMNVGALPNDAATPLILSFPKKSIQWLKFTVTQVAPTTENVGLAEIAVFQDPK